MVFLILGSLLGMLSVAFGAFGAHMLKPRLESDLLAIYETAVQYQMYHALALLVVALLIRFMGNVPLLQASGWLFMAGIIIFSGSLYTLSLTGIRVLGAITPIGGVAFIAGWLLLLFAAYRHWQ